MRQPLPPSRSVPCPYCGVPAGRRCMTSTGNGSHESHALRKRAHTSKIRTELTDQLARIFGVPRELLNEDKEWVYAVPGDQ